MTEPVSHGHVNHPHPDVTVWCTLAEVLPADPAAAPPDPETSLFDLGLDTEGAHALQHLSDTRQSTRSAWPVSSAVQRRQAISVRD